LSTLLNKRKEWCPPQLEEAKVELRAAQIPANEPKPHQIVRRFRYIRNNLNEDLIDRSTERRGISIGSTSEKRKKITMISAEQKRILSISSCVFFFFTLSLTRKIWLQHRGQERVEVKREEGSLSTSFIQGWTTSHERKSLKT